MSFESLPAIVLREGIRKSWGDLVGSNFDDHEDRLVDLEDQIGLDASSLAAGFYVATVELTDAQIKTLPTTAIEIVAAPAANQRVKYHGATYTAWFENGAYTNVDTTTAELYLRTSSGSKLGGSLVNDSGASVTSLTTVLASASVLVVDLGPYLTNSGGTFVQPVLTTGPGSVAGKAVQLFALNNGAGNFTGGHTSNRLTVQMYYSLETTQTYQMPFRAMKFRRQRPLLKRPALSVSVPTTLL